MAEKKLNTTKAVIDLGTNTFNLLIADVGFDRIDIVLSIQEPVLLGMGGINEKRITDEAKQRATSTLCMFVALCRHNGVEPDHIQALGTSAIRDAQNQAEFIREIHSATGLRIEVISGDREAELISKGVQWIHSFSVPSMIMDIGGGSTEFIWSGPDGVAAYESLDIGISRIYQALGEPFHYGASAQAFVRNYLEERYTFRSDQHAEVLIGVSGSFETLWEMIHEQRFPLVGEIQELDITRVLELLEWIIHSSWIDRKDHLWILPVRRRMLPISALKIQWVLNHLKIKRFMVSPYAMKEGALAEDVQ